jgi:hypothetical protein
MKINHTNYEEFLLLYIDGELSVAMQQQVELFIEQNPIISTEFNLLLNAKLQLEDLSFGDITPLLKNENAEIGLNNYEEKFLLYVDNELSNTENKNIETYVLQHPTLQPVFTSLKQTKLPVEIISYPNKKELYKKEKNIVFYFQKFAVAAIFIGIIAFTWNIIYSNKKQETIVKAENKKVEANAKSVIILQKEFSNNLASKTINNNNKKRELIVLKQPTVTTQNTTIEIVKQNLSTPIKNENIPNNTLVANQLPNSNNDIVTNQTKPTNPELNNAVSTNQATNSEISNTKVEAVAVVYKTLDEDDDENTTPKNQSKIKKLLSKAAKIINPESKADNDSKKIFAVNL